MASHTTVSPTPPVRPTPPPLPQAATRNDDAGQQAFIRYWFDLYNYAIATGDTGPVKAASRPDSVSTQKMTKQVEDVYGGGGHAEGNEFFVIEAVTVPPDEDGLTAPTVTYGHEAGTEVYGDGRVKSVPRQDRVDWAMFIRFKDGRWTFLDFTRL